MEQPKARSLRKLRPVVQQQPKLTARQNLRNSLILECGEALAGALQLALVSIAVPPIFLLLRSLALHGDTSAYPHSKAAIASLLGTTFICTFAIVSAVMLLVIIVRYTIAVIHASPES